MVFDQYDVGIRPACHDLLSPGQLQRGRLGVDAPDLEQPIEFHDLILSDTPGPQAAVTPTASAAIPRSRFPRKVHCSGGR